MEKVGDNFLQKSQRMHPSILFAFRIVFVSLFILQAQSLPIRDGDDSDLSERPAKSPRLSHKSAPSKSVQIPPGQSSTETQDIKFAKEVTKFLHDHVSSNVIYETIFRTEWQHIFKFLENDFSINNKIKAVEAVDTFVQAGLWTELATMSISSSAMERPVLLEKVVDSIEHLPESKKSNFFLKLILQSLKLGFAKDVRELKKKASKFMRLGPRIRLETHLDNAVKKWEKIVSEGLTDKVVDQAILKVGQDFLREWDEYNANGRMSHDSVTSENAQLRHKYRELGMDMIDLDLSSFEHSIRNHPPHLDTTHMSPPRFPFSLH
jgi:hypothetical protein